MKVFIKYLAYILIISAFFRIIPIIAAIFYKESTKSFLITFFISLFLGLSLLWLGKRIESKKTTLTLNKSLMLVAVSFIILPLISSISFLPSFNYNLLDAVFESISGFTTTGLTLYQSLEGLPKSLILWRAETQWMGGIGIIMVFLFIFSRLKVHTYTRVIEAEADTQSSMALYQAQGFSEKLDPDFKKTTANIMLIYTIYTVLGIILLFAFGMPLFDSIGMTFTSLSTGGFAVSDTFYTNNLQLAVLSFLMILGSISFIAHNKLLQRKFKEFFSSFEKNVFLLVIIASILIVFIAYKDVKIIIFQVISSFTTTGYSLTSISLLPQLFILVIMAGMIIGGSVASTSGGIKVFRIYALVKSVPWLLKKLSSPDSAIIPFKIRDKSMEETNLLIIQIFFSFYIFILLIGTLVLMSLGYDFLDSSFQMTSALGTVGLQTMELSEVHWIAKSILMITMLLGRLEIFPLLILIRNLFTK